MSDKVLVFYDLETGGGEDPEILQIGAVAEGSAFSKYVKPTRQILDGSSNVNGLSVVNGELRYRNQPVPTVSLKNALEDFLKFLQRFTPRLCVLVAQDGDRFDHKLIQRDIMHTGVSGLKNCVWGTIDTLQVFKEVLPGRDHYKQQVLAKEFLNEDQGHEALADAKQLERLAAKIVPNSDNMMKFARQL